MKRSWHKWTLKTPTFIVIPSEWKCVCNCTILYANIVHKVKLHRYKFFFEEGWGLTGTTHACFTSSKLSAPLSPTFRISHGQFWFWTADTVSIAILKSREWRGMSLLKCIDTQSMRTVLKKPRDCTCRSSISVCIFLADKKIFFQDSILYMPPMTVHICIFCMWNYLINIFWRGTFNFRNYPFTMWLKLFHCFPVAAFQLYSNPGLLQYSEPVFLNVYGALASIPRNEFRQLM
jgi:hypothetical protein